jgi:hypothetical protein
MLKPAGFFDQNPALDVPPGPSRTATEAERRGSGI